MNKLHKSLMDKKSWYTNWHNQPNRHYIQWLFLVAVLVGFTALFYNRLNNPDGLALQGMQSLAASNHSNNKEVKYNEAQKLTKDVFEALKTWERDQNPTTLNNLEQLAQARKQFLLDNSTDNGTVKDIIHRNAFPEAIYNKFPASVQPYIEKKVKLKGALEVFVAENMPEHMDPETWTSKTSIVIKVSGRKYQISLTSDNQSLKTDDVVVVNGFQLGDMVSVNNLDPQNLVVVQTALPGVLGEHKILMILVNFQDEQTQPYTVDQARGIITDTSNYWRETSFGQTWATGDVYGWYTIPVSYTNCDVYAIGNYAKQAAASAGANLSAYNHFVYVFPHNTACIFGGNASVGMGNQTPQVQLNEYLSLHAMIHELGHNFGLLHAHSLDCRPEIMMGSCYSREYGDIYEPMGAERISNLHYNMFNKEQLGWDTARTVTSSGTYHINANEVSGGANGLKVLGTLNPLGNVWSYIYIAYKNAVVVTLGTDNNPGSSYLLDMVPSTLSWEDSPLAVGQSFTDPTGTVTLRTLSADATGADVQITVSPKPCVRANPTVSITPASQTLTGTMMQYNYTVTNNDSLYCTPSIFNLPYPARPQHDLETSLSEYSYYLIPGQSYTGYIYLYVTYGSTIPAGTYNINISATNRDFQTYTSAASAVVVVSSGGPDTTPPVLSAGSPSGIQATGTTSVNMTLATNETATCKYGSTAGVAYSSLPSTFTTTNSTSHSVSITGLTNGSSRTYYVRCQDTSSNANTIDYTISFSVASGGDITPPTVNMTPPPANGATVSGSVTLSATAADNVAVAGVQFKINGVNVELEDTTAPYSVNWITTTGANGPYTITAVARDAAGNSTVSSPAVNVTVSNVVSTPAHITLSTNSLNFFGVNGGPTPPNQPVMLSNTGGTNLNWTSTTSLPWCHASPSGPSTFAPSTGYFLYITVDAPSSVGSFTCNITISDPNAASSPQTIAVNYTVSSATDITPPVITMTAPVNNSTVSGSSVTVSADATDNVAVAGVKFTLDGSTNIGAEDTTAPYAVTLDTTNISSAMTHYIFATARDAAGNTSRSSVIVSIDHSTMVITTQSIPQATRNQPYSVAFTNTGGLAPYTWSAIISNGITGYQINPTTGVLTGTFTRNGNYTLVVTLTDSNGLSSMRRYTLKVH